MNWELDLITPITFRHQPSQTHFLQPNQSLAHFRPLCSLTPSVTCHPAAKQPASLHAEIAQRFTHLDFGFHPRLSACLGHNEHRAPLCFSFCLLYFNKPNLEHTRVTSSFQAGQRHDTSLCLLITLTRCWCNHLYFVILEQEWSKSMTPVWL